ncbi:Uncharacterised protein [Vibrio cholerae]|nr:Uncharacterised protein [Vibrio cholerae]
MITIAVASRLMKYIKNMVAIYRIYDGSSTTASLCDRGRMGKFYLSRAATAYCAACTEYFD